MTPSETRRLSYSDQCAIVEKCIKTGLDLGLELRALGYNYDDLRYKYDGNPGQIERRYVSFEDLPRLDCRVPMVSFFAGCGGLDLGFEAAGFRHVALIDNNPICSETLRRNRPEWKVVGPPLFAGDVSQREDLASLLLDLGLSVPFEGVFCGGPPCQPFSIAANQRFSRWGENFKRIGFSDSVRGNLLFDFLWFIDQFRPAAFLIENVAGLLTVDGGQQLANAIRGLEAMGYTLERPMLLEASEFGIPQRRHRLFLVGSRQAALFSPPQGGGAKVPCGELLWPPPNGIENHVTREHKASSIARYALLKYGERDRLGRVDRLDPGTPSKTVIAGGSSGGGRSHLHPFIPRTLSVRECARLQGFPDSFVFSGTPARQFTQVGNAVPPKLAYCVAAAMLRSYF